MFSEISLTALDLSDEILVLFAPELASVRSTALVLEAFDSLGYPDDKVRLLLNWIFERQGLPKADIEAGLGREIKIIIPYASEIFVRAINFGTPPTLEKPDSPLGAIFENLAFSVSTAEQKRQRPDDPTEAWKRLARRMRKQRR